MDPPVLWSLLDADGAEVAGLVAWLVSPEAAYVSGTSVVIDGGLETQVSLS